MAISPQRAIRSTNIARVIFAIAQLSCTRKLRYRKDDHASNEMWRRYGHSKLSKMAACRQLGFDVTGNSAIRSADPENPIPEPNMKCIGSPIAQIRPFEIFRCCYWLTSTPAESLLISSLFASSAYGTQVISSCSLRYYSCCHQRPTLAALTQKRQDTR